MKHKYVSGTVLLTLSLVLLYAISLNSVYAETDDGGLAPRSSSVEVKTNIEGSVRANIRDDDDDKSIRMGIALEDDLEVRKDLIEQQRERLIQTAEARKKALEAKKDTAGAMREEMRIKIEEKRAEMDEKREALREEFELKRASSTEKRIEWQQEVAKRKADHTAKVITATIERLEKIIARIESRIAKVKGQGGSTTEAEGFVAEAKVSLNAAEVSVQGFASLDLSSNKAQENFEKVRTLAAEAREHIRDAHTKMMLAIRSLGAVDKEAVPPITATTTATTTVGTQ